MGLPLLELFEIVVAVCLCLLVTAAWYIHRQHQKYDHLPGPPRDSFWSGHIPSISKVVAGGGIMDDYFIEISKTHGLIFRLCFFHRTLVIVLDPDCIKDVLVTGNHPKSKRLYSRVGSVFGARFLGKGIESQIDSKNWILQRMHFDQWFKPHNIRQFASDFNEFADHFTEFLETQADGKTKISMTHFFNKFTLNLLYKVAFNTDLGPLHGESHPYATSLSKALIGFEAYLSNPLVTMNPFKWKFRRDVRKALHTLRRKARQEMIDRGVAKHNGDYFPHDLLEYIMELKEKYPEVMTDEILLDNFATFILAGHETSANAMAFMIFLLAQNPECYKKLQQEIDENVGAVSVITLNEIEKLPYLDMVLKETLRLFPVAKATFRETAKDYNLGGHLIPACTEMLISFYATSRAEQNVKNPTKFLPERFHSDISENINKYTSTPFSAGPHTCIGKKFAEIEIKITISKIMQNFDFELVPGETSSLENSILLHAKDGVNCYFRPRTIGGGIN